jgi:hypothetical protein
MKDDLASEKLTLTDEDMNLIENMGLSALR